MLFNYNYLTELIVTCFDTSSGVDFSRMFEGCTGLKSRLNGEKFGTKFL